MRIIGNAITRKNGTMSDTSLSSKEQGAFDALKHKLKEKFNIPDADISACMERNVVGYREGKPEKRDVMRLEISSPVFDDKGAEVYALPLQHDLVGEFCKHWKVGTPPMLTVDIEHEQKPTDPNISTGWEGYFDGSQPDEADVSDEDRLKQMYGHIFESRRDREDPSPA